MPAYRGIDTPFEREAITTSSANGVSKNWDLRYFHVANQLGRITTVTVRRTFVFKLTL
jgi:hypothetical protein